jgi:hypothetical protein
MISPFVIPDFVDPYALSVDDRWGDRKLTGVNLSKNWGKLTLKQCQNWQRDSFNYACTGNLTSMEWAKSLMMNSCDVLLVDRIDKKFYELDLYKQGGGTYIKIALDEMFTISTTVVTTLPGFFEAFAKDGIAKVPNEDVRAATEQIIAVAERLTEVSALPSESTRHILEGFTWCSVILFRQTSAHLLVAERWQLLPCHVWGCPVYVLEAKLQNDQKLPKWNRRARLGQFVGFSDDHSSLVANGWHLTTGYISPQFHVVFDDLFETVNCIGVDDRVDESICNGLFQCN